MSIAKSGADVTEINNGSLIIFTYFATMRTNREYPAFSNTCPLCASLKQPAIKSIKMTDTRDLIWNAITDSAKRRFDYPSFSKDFDEIDENIAENVLFKVIIGFASKQKEDIIVLELFNQMMMLGFIWEQEDIKSFVQGKDDLFKAEIYTTQIASSLLENGNDPMAVLNSIQPLLN